MSEDVEYLLLMARR